MIQYTKGNLFFGNHDCLVNPVNCLGVSGAGLAKEFKEKFPIGFEVYRQVCKDGKMRPGKPLVFCERGINIFYFPTKDDWRNPSQLDYIRDGVKSLRQFLEDNPDIRSVGVPKLGCGLGGLKWVDVRSVLEDGLRWLNADIWLYGER